jgi:hypothetical protein
MIQTTSAIAATAIRAFFIGDDEIGTTDVDRPGDDRRW